MILHADNDGNLVARADGRDGHLWLVTKAGEVAHVEERAWKISTTIVPKRFRGASALPGEAPQNMNPEPKRE